MCLTFYNIFRSYNIYYIIINFMVKIQLITILFGEIKTDSSFPSSFEQLILQTLSRILERDLAALLFGAAVMLVVLIKYWNVPKKWEYTHDRLQRIEKRQKNIIQYSWSILQKLNLWMWKMMTMLTKMMRIMKMIKKRIVFIAKQNIIFYCWDFYIFIY